MSKVLRGEVWLIDLNPVRGHEQARKRPCLVISVNLFNQGSSGLAIVLPITSKNKSIPFHVEVNPPEAKLKTQSFIKCEDVRSVSLERFDKKLGTVSEETLEKVEEILRILMSL